MMLNRTNTVLAVLVLVVFAMAAMSGVDYSKPNIEVLPDMKYSPAFSSYSQNPVLENGQTMQPPVAGTIARGQITLHYAATKEDAVRAGEELANPFSLAEIEARLRESSERSETHQSADEGPAAATAPEQQTLESEVQRQYTASVARGGDVYRVFCNSCHGPQGMGDGPVAKRGFPPPPSLLGGKSLQMKDGQLFHIVTYGQGNMAPFAAQLPPDRRWDVVNFIRRLQSNAPQPAPPADDVTANSAAPETIEKEEPAEKTESRPASKSEEDDDERKPESKQTTTEKPAP